MQITKISTNFNKNYYAQKPTFKSKALAKAIESKNIGSMPVGFIGKIKTLKANGEEAFLNVIKSAYKDYETYQLQDNYERVIGKIEFRFNKYIYKIKNEKDHVFVSELRNFSNPNTPYYKQGLEEYKHIGTKLLQLAQIRSFENNCNGNIELIAKNRKEVIEFYKNLGFKQFENISIYENPYRLQLAPESISLLANKYDGLELL